jgi:hypothetical protein
MRMRLDSYVVRRLDPNNDAQMDAFNDEFNAACAKLGLSPLDDPETVTFEQAAAYLEVSPRTVMRYCYAKPQVLELKKIEYDQSSGVREHSEVVLDSVVEMVVARRMKVR